MDRIFFFTGSSSFKKMENEQQKVYPELIKKNITWVHFEFLILSEP